MSNEHLNNLANELKSAREKNKITIEQIFIKTRIDKKYLSAIESGNFAVMPEVYIRAFVKEYAKSVGLDPEEIINKFDHAKEGKAYIDPEAENDNQKTTWDERTFGEEVKSPQADSIVHSADKSGSSNISIYYLIAAVSLLLTIFIIYRVFLSEDDNTIITEKPFEEIVENQVTDNLESNEIDDPSNSQIGNLESESDNLPNDQINNQNQIEEADIVQQPLKEGEMTLTIFAEDESWMRVVSDESNNIEFIIQKGMTKVISAKDKFYLHIGNSGAIKLYLNNEDIQFRGSPGKVRKVFITEDGIEYLRRTPTLNVEQE